MMPQLMPQLMKQMLIRKSCGFLKPGRAVVGVEPAPLGCPRPLPALYYHKYLAQIFSPKTG